MNDFNSKLWDWLIKRSPKDASRPDVQTSPSDDMVDSAQPYRGQRIETNIEAQRILGLLLRMAVTDSVCRTPDGELLRMHNDETVVLLGCGHLGTPRKRAGQKNDKIKQIAGQCRHCAADLQQEFVNDTQTDLLGLLHKELKTLICEDCARITTSGHLACSDHSTEAVGPDGQKRFLGPEEAKEQERKDITEAILGPVCYLLCQNGQKKIPPENSKDKKQ